MRDPRLRVPNQFIEVTLRCHDSQYRLIPTEERVGIVGTWLGIASKKYRGVELVVVMQMGNHIHAVYFDRYAELSDFTEVAHGGIAKTLNRLDDRYGTVFDERHSEFTILDEEALVRRIVYAVTNPVKAGLVSTYKEWKGVCLFPRAETVQYPFSYVDPSYYRDLEDAKRTGKTVNRRDYVRSSVVTVPGVPAHLARAIEDGIRQRERDLRALQTGVVGMEQVLRTSPFDKPKASKRSRAPKCVGTGKAICDRFMFMWRTFVDAYRSASEKFRAGDLNTPFPPYCFRPITRVAPPDRFLGLQPS